MNRRPAHPSHPSARSTPTRGGRSTHTALPARRTQGTTREPSAEEAGGFSHLLRKLPLTLGMTALLGAGLLTAAAALALWSNDPTALSTPLSLAALALTALGGGVAAGRRCPTSPVAASLAAGLSWALILTLLSLWVGQGSPADGIPTGDSAAPLGGMAVALPWLIRAAVVALHCLGGRLSRPRREPPTHRRGGRSS